jgi:hypothetical protein
MKKYLLILFLSLTASFAGFGQSEEQEDRGGKLAERMKEYVQKRLNLTSGEAEKFSPVFLRYLLELRKTHRDFRTDVPMRQLKIAELRVRFRTEFRQIMDEQRANKIFDYQREFEDKIRIEIQERQRQNKRNIGPRTRMVTREI